MNKEVTARSVQLTELAQAPATAKPAFGEKLDLIAGLKVRVSACVGQREITVRQLFGLKDGEILELDRGSDDPVDLYLDGKLIGRGELVVVGDNFGIRLIELGGGVP